METFDNGAMKVLKPVEDKDPVKGSVCIVPVIFCTMPSVNDDNEGDARYKLWRLDVRELW